MSLRECGARSRTNGHKPCRQPAMANGRCRLHGGLAKKGPKNVSESGRLAQKMGSWKHGKYSAETIAENHMIRQFLRESKDYLGSI